MAISSNDSDEIMSSINITPLVDVCLVLVIIFMVTAPLLSDPAFKVNLPVARTQEGEEKEKIIVSISDGEKYSVNEVVFKTKENLFSGIDKALSASDLKLVIIKADKNAGYGILTDVMAKAKDSGAVNITIATEQLKKRKQ